MRNDLKIIDAHMHLISSAAYEQEQKRLAESTETYRKGYSRWQEGFKKKFNSPVQEAAGKDTEDLAMRWEQLLNAAGVDTALFIASNPDCTELFDFVAKRPLRFFALCTVDPHDKNAPEYLRLAVQQHKVRGLKLYPTVGRFELSDPMLYPIYEEAASLGIPIAAHLGITLSYNSDMRYSSPASLHAAARDFPNIPFIIPHFAAGYLQELLFLGYHVPNIYIDTSGTNRWIDYMAVPINLSAVFKKTLDVFGPEHILFGTDSRMLSQGYRTAVLEEQERILKELGLSQTEQALILSGNAERIYQLN